jgi:hypothetical protein
MGMMDQMAPMEQPAAPTPQGMMGGQPPAQSANPSLSHGKFNGTVDVQGKPVEVKAGVAMVDGKPFMVSDDGAMVVNAEGNLVGHIEGDKFMVADAAYMKQMQDAGYVQ